MKDQTTGEEWDLAPGTVYVVGPKDRHQIQANTDFYLMSVFNPPLVGEMRPTTTRVDTRPAGLFRRPGGSS